MSSGSHLFGTRLTQRSRRRLMRSVDNVTLITAKTRCKYSYVASLSSMFNSRRTGDVSSDKQLINMSNTVY